MNYMKYVTFIDEEDSESIIIFPDFINHDEMALYSCRAAMCSPLKNMLTPISAGSVANGTRCYGESVTLNLVSRGDLDTALLKSMSGS
jgi:hypothetical protein